MLESIILNASRSATQQKVTIKLAPKDRFDNELRVLQTVKANQSIRPLVDATEDPPCLVLRYLDDNLLDASNDKRLDKSDIKFVARSVLTALEALHKQGYVHTGQTPSPVSAGQRH